MTVHVLMRNLYDRRFEGFASKGRSPLRKLELEDHLEGPDVPRFAADWKPVKVVGNVRPMNDFPCIDLTIPAFSPRAVDALRDLLEPNGELLPVDSDLGPYYAYNTTTVADVLDMERSKIKRLPSGPVLTIDRYEFIPNRVTGLSVFKIPQDLSEAYVTDEFAARIRDHNLKGFDLMTAWPVPPGANWRKLHAESRRKSKSKTPP